MAYSLIPCRRYFADILNGTTATQIEKDENTWPVTRIESISNGVVDYQRLGYVTPAANLERFRLSQGDILFSHINSLSMIGNCALYEGAEPLFAGMNLLRLKPLADAHPKFLYYCFSSTFVRSQVRTYAKPAINQASISTANLKRVLLPHVDLATQKAIAVFLDRETDRIDQLIEKVGGSNAAKLATEGSFVSLLMEKRASMITAAVTGQLSVTVEAAESRTPTSHSR
ncbi:MAG: restriction endonuclease subunit S [Thermomicrobiales bacterium]